MNCEFYTQCMHKSSCCFVVVINTVGDKQQLWWLKINMQIRTMYSSLDVFQKLTPFLTTVQWIFITHLYNHFRGHFNAKKRLNSKWKIMAIEIFWKWWSLPSVETVRSSRGSIWPGCFSFLRCFLTFLRHSSRTPVAGLFFRCVPSSLQQNKFSLKSPRWVSYMCFCTKRDDLQGILRSHQHFSLKMAFWPTAVFHLILLLGLSLPRFLSCSRWDHTPWPAPHV